jgi:hypothetical protein
MSGQVWMPQCSEGNVAVGFSGPRNSGDLLRQVLVLTYQLLMLFKRRSEKAVAILDIEAWASSGATFARDTYRLF